MEAFIAYLVGSPEGRGSTEKTDRRSDFRHSLHVLLRYRTAQSVVTAGHCPQSTDPEKDFRPTLGSVPLPN